MVESRLSGRLIDLRREAIVLDSMDDTSLMLVDVLVENGYSVHVITVEERGELFVRKPVYIRLVPDMNSIDESILSEVLRDVEFNYVEASILISPNEDLNIKVARYMKEQGIPVIIVALKSSEKISEAEAEGFSVINVPGCILGRIQRTLSLKFYRITPIRGRVSMLESFVTGDMKILGSTIREIEEKYNVSVMIIRGSEDLHNAPDEVIQEGDYIVVIGPLDNLFELVK